MLHFHKVVWVQYLGEVDIFSYMCKEFRPLQRCKNYRNRSRFFKVMLTNVLPPFVIVHPVCSLCRIRRGFRKLLSDRHICRYIQEFYTFKNGPFLLTLYTGVDECMNRRFWTFLLPWPWPDDLHIRVMFVYEGHQVKVTGARKAKTPVDAFIYPSNNLRRTCSHTCATLHYSW